MEKSFTWLLCVIFLLVITSCNSDKPAPSLNISLNQNWEFSESGTNVWMPAKVPGTVHADLLANGVIEDPHFRLNENDVQWIENKEWVYRTYFKVDDNLLLFNVSELIFDGLDTYADVYLNDKLLLEADNMYVAHQINVKDYLKAGDNELRVVFHSPVEKGMEKLTQLDYLLPAANEQAPEGKQTNIFTRKAPFHYGWDWGPRLVTSGIWRNVSLKAYDLAKIENIYVHTSRIENNRAMLSGYAEIKVESEGEYTLNLVIDNRTKKVNKRLQLNPGTQQIEFEFDIEEPELWWSNGLGEPHLYDFVFNLSKGRQVIDHKELAFGVRTLELVQEPDETGRSFYFRLNGIPVFMKGANVIPSNTLTPSVSEETYHRLIKNAVDANMNMLRVWGGAIYEEELFYELCDRNGILVWQDFMFACALQPGDEAHLENIRKEAEYNVKRLRNHACIALWCGNNENLHGWHHWGWKESYQPAVRDFVWRTYERIFYEILPSAVKKFDPKTEYWSSSPTAYGDLLADRKSGDEHDWTVWFGQQPFSNYEKNVPRFVSEYGLQAFPSMHTIRQFSEEDDWDIHSEVMRRRQRSNMNWVSPGFNGNDMINWYMDKYYQVPDNFGDFVYVSQLMHALAYKTAIEAHRRNMPHCMGSLYWQLNDSWPTISWATVDFYGRWKASHYAVRDANAALMISPTVENDKLVVYAVSDLLEQQSSDLHISLISFFGDTLYSFTSGVTVPPNQSSKIYTVALDELSKNGFDKSKVVIHAVLKNGKEVKTENLFYFVTPKELELSGANVAVSARKTGSGYEIQLTADVLVKNLFIDTAVPDVFFSDNYFDLLPGKPKIIQAVTTSELNVENDFLLKYLNRMQ
jgi:beta-mannosidase